jgi:predicted Zn-dependent peptidase
MQVVIKYVYNKALRVPEPYVSAKCRMFILHFTVRGQLCLILYDNTFEFPGRRGPIPYTFPGARALVSLNRTQAPLSNSIPAFEFPPIHKAVLDNGMDVLIIQDNTQPLINISLSIPAGAVHEPVAGLARCTARMLMQGNQRMNAEQIAESLDNLGVSMGAGAGWDYTEISALMLEEFTGEVLQIFADCIIRPLFEEDEIQRRRRLALADLQHMQADPEYMGSRALALGLYPGHPYSHARHGSAESLQSIDSAACHAWHQMLLNIPGSFFTVAGACIPDNIIGQLNQYFGTWKPAGSAPSMPPKSVLSQGISIISAEKNDAAQTVLMAGFHVIGIDHPDYTLLQLCSTIYGGYFASRINMILREQLGYTYGAYSYIDSRAAGNAFITGANVGVETTGHSAQVILQELQRLHEQIIPDQEFETARQFMLGSLVQGTETAQQISGRVQTIRRYALPDDYYTRRFTDLAAATPQDLYRVQQRYFNPGSIVIAACTAPGIARQSLLPLGSSIQEFAESF